MRELVLNDGEYTVINDLGHGGGFRALMYGSEWRNLAGDNLSLAMFHRIEALEERLTEAESLLGEAHDILDDVHCYETETYRSISKYFGEDE